MKKILFSSLLSLFFTGSIVTGQTPRLEIHHIGAGDGDATLFIIIDQIGVNAFNDQPVMDTAVILIDGQRSSGGEEVWRYTKAKVNALDPNRKSVDLIVVSHLHTDHFEGITSLVSSAKTDNWTIKAVVDGQNANYSDYLPQENIDCYGVFNDEEPTSEAFQKYRNTLAQSKLTPTYTIFPGVDLISAFGFDHITMYCVVANGQILGPDGHFVNFLPTVEKNGFTYYNPKSPNDLSIGFQIEFQGFHYLTLGDLGGVNGGNYVDGETSVTKFLVASANSEDYHMCGLKVSHHGSAESSTKWFVKTNNPTVSIIEAACRTYGRSKYPLPTEVAIKNLQSIVSNNLFFTFVSNDPTDISSFWTKNSFKYYNDVVLTVTGLPGFDGDIEMQITQAQKTEDFVYNGVTSTQTITCTKGHNWEEEEDTDTNE